MSAMRAVDAWPAAGQPFTDGELDQMPEDGRRYEVLDGALVAGPRPGALHQVLAARLAGTLLAACPDGMFVLSGRDVRLSRTTVFAPDITVARHRPPGGGRLTEPPLLAAEIRPPGAALIDLDRRKAAYHAFGVRAYWVIVPDTRWPELTIFEPAGGQYERVARAVGGEVFRARQPFRVEVIPARLAAGLRPARRHRDQRDRLTGPPSSWQQAPSSPAFRPGGTAGRSGPGGI